MRLRVVSKHLGMFASAFALCGLTFVGSAGAGMLDISSTSPVNHLVVRPHNRECCEHVVCHEPESCKKEQQEHEQEQQQEHQQEMEIQRLRVAMSHFASSSESNESKESKSAQSAQALPYTGSDPGNHRLP